MNLFGTFGQLFAIALALAFVLAQFDDVFYFRVLQADDIHGYFNRSRQAA
mgnify:CR=1 FL=1